MPRRPFFFGASTSSHQVEGGNHNDWTEWEKENATRLVAQAYDRHGRDPWGAHLLNKYFTPLKVENYISGLAADHYHRFREDFDIARSIGHNAHRFSIEWSRVEPEEGAFNEKEIKHYGEVIRTLRDRGIEPFVTLWHFTLPLWLAAKGGTQNKRFPEYLARFARKMTLVFREEVKYWITVNEPEIYAAGAYFLGKWPPQKTSIALAFRSLRNSIHAHELAYRAIKAEAPEARVGVAVNLTYFDAETGLANNVFKFLADRLWNSYFLSRIRHSLDFVGFNYYFRNHINWGFNKNPNELISDLKWEIYPQGIYHIIKNLKKYHLPIYITENGIADARDAQREFFLREHLSWVRKAVDEGADVRGYFHWSLLDNFEWDSGFWPAFGLVEVDYGTMKRTVRPSAFGYKKIIESWDEKA